MSEKRSTEGTHNRTWAIYLSSQHDPVFIGTVVASTSELAIKAAIEEFKITSPQVRARLVANIHGW
jgi:hypothetical protein